MTMYRGGYLVLVLLLLVTAAWPVHARVSGPCENCHTMHNSQDNVPVDVEGAHNYLLNQGSDPCVACHTGTNIGGGTNEGVIPYVYNTSEPDYGTNTLAGGNFYWVTQDDTKGHNCISIDGVDSDSNLTQAPGKPDVAGGPNCATCHDQITNCESCHKPAHHADDTQSPVVGKTGGWYRFLNSSFHASDTTGVIGIEDNDWEYTVSASDHNEYAGCTNPYGNNDNSMSNYCGGCHMRFHELSYTDDGDNQSPWLRHPTHYALSDTAPDKEYHNYNDGNGYSPLAPIARDQDRLREMTGPSATVYVQTSDTNGDQVMCLSCHRPHGSPYSDLLRWDYEACEAGSGNPQDCGCYVCHTTKDEP